MTGSQPFFVLVGVGFVLLLVVLFVSIVVGAIRRSRGRHFSDEIEAAAGLAPPSVKLRGRRARRRDRRAAA